MSGSFNLSPLYFFLPDFTPKQHASKVYDKLVESIQNMKKPSKTQLLKKMTKALHVLSTNLAVTLLQRVATLPTLEGGGYPTQRVASVLSVTTSTNPTAPRTLR